MRSDGHLERDPHGTTAVAHLDGSQRVGDAHCASAAVDSPGGQTRHDTQSKPASGSLSGGQTSRDARSGSASADLAAANGATAPRRVTQPQILPAPKTGAPPTAPSGPDQVAPASSDTKPKANSRAPSSAVSLAERDAQHGLADGTPLGLRQTSRDDHLEAHNHNAEGSTAAHDALLLILADALDDLERVRIGTENRVRSLIQVKGLEGSPEETKMRALAGEIATLEHRATLDLQRAMRAHPLGAWVKRTVGVGEKQAARLLAAIGNPATRQNSAKLWAYCGFHVIDGQRPRRRRGERANWSNTAKMRARLIAESCIKQANSPYRPVYDRERAKWAERDTTDLHKHNHALAVVAKAVLLDLWREARRV